VIKAIKKFLQDWSDSRNEVEMFMTHTPHAFKLGQAIDGRRITRIERIGGTALFKGGVAACWRVLGVEMAASALLRREE
jgi:hypothetical protein